MQYAIKRVGAPGQVATNMNVYAMELGVEKQSFPEILYNEFVYILLIVVKWYSCPRILSIFF